MMLECLGKKIGYVRGNEYLIGQNIILGYINK